MNYKHGKCNTPTYYCWWNMINRCQNPKVKSFRDYGQRGITVCDRWQQFKNFLEDMGEKPKKLTIERIDNCQGYSKENCRWATRAEQGKNRSSYRLLTVFGKTHPISEWSRITGINHTTIHMRLEYGWTVEEALRA